MNAEYQMVDNDRHMPAVELLRGARVGIVGGGEFCRKLIDFFENQDSSPRKPQFIGVADIAPDAPGLAYARQLDIYTTDDFRQLLDLDGLEVVLEITHDADLAPVIMDHLPAQTRLIDHFHARYLWDTLQVEAIRQSTLEAFGRQKGDPAAVEQLIRKGFDCFETIISRRNERSRDIELELVANERRQSQIIQGSTIPTFVIDQDHRVTHWNRALERLSGKSAEEVVGTRKQWSPFWKNERPTMADVILDQIDEDGIRKLYGHQWSKSALIDGAYEAEVFFPRVGKYGKWLWFTAAPIKAADGTIVGAIETLWDKTEDKKAEEERERHTAELAALCSIYTALSAPWSIDHRIETAIKEIQAYLLVDDILVFLQDDQGGFFLKYHYGRGQRQSPKNHTDAYRKYIQKVADAGRAVYVESLTRRQHRAMQNLMDEGFKSVVLMPIIAKQKKAIGIIQIASYAEISFEASERHALDLIGNRIGVAIENSMLQKQYIKSEEKYRSLFNNDPNPIFIISPESLEILDVNDRMLECYGYRRDLLLGKPFMSLGVEGDQEVVEVMRQLPIGHSALILKKRHRRRDGGRLYVNISVSHAKYGEGDVLIATTTDITEAVEKETQLIQASKMTTLGLMAAGMAHEINQPLNVIQICADYFIKMLKRGQAIGDDDLRGMANDIITNVDRATGIIKHVRHFARQSEVVKSRVNINEPIEDVFKVLGHQIKVHQIALDLDLDAKIPYVMADHNRLEQVFINLITNAIDALDEKAGLAEHQGIRKLLKVSTHRAKDSVIATVSDNGIGMSEETRNKLFEPFFTTKEVGKGTGLGVSISYGIVKDYQGDIQIDSREGQGTTFTLTFPSAAGPDLERHE